jgi:hypothetical protein
LNVQDVSEELQYEEFHITSNDNDVEDMLTHVRVPNPKMIVLVLALSPAPDNDVAWLIS